MLYKKIFKNSSTSYSQFLTKKSRAYLNIPSISTVNFDFFKRSATFHYQHLYAEKKSQNVFYRAIFFSFSLIFMILGIMIFFKTTNPSCSIYFGNCSMIKDCVNAICLMLAGCSFALGYFLNPEKEAIKYLIKKVKNELKQPTKNLQIEFKQLFYSKG